MVSDRLKSSGRIWTQGGRCLTSHFGGVQMKVYSLLMATLTCLPLAPAFGADHDPHQVHAGDHEHVHGPGCGHTGEVHGGHVDYEHNGHHHHYHGGHVHEDGGNHDGVVAIANGIAAEHHAVHLEHSHVHGPACGHAGSLHEGHIDYEHGGHRHHVHSGVTHECI